MAKKKIVRLRRQDQLYVQIPTFIIIVIAICFALLPTIITWLNSVKTQSEINLSIMAFPKGFEWENYVDAFLKFYNMFLLDYETFDEIFSKYDREDLVAKLEKM